jgi:hypothetical protein
MGEMLVVAHLTRHNVPDHLYAAASTAMQQVPFAEGLQQRLSLVEPGCIERHLEQMDARRQVVKECRGLAAGMAGAIVDDQVDALRPAVRMQEL